MLVVSKVWQAEAADDMSESEHKAEMAEAAVEKP